MSSIPLPALDIRPQQPNDALGSVEKLMALKSMMGQQQVQQQQIQAGQQEQQIRQQQIADQQATTTAMKSWDGKDYDSLSKSVLDNGGSANAAFAIQQHGLTIKKTVSDLAAADATTGSKNLETFVGRQKAIGDALEGVESIPDAQLHDAAAAKVDQLTKAGILDPQTAQQAAQVIQTTTDPQQLRQKIDMLAKTSLGAMNAATQQKTLAETANDTAQAGEATANTKKTQMELDSGASPALADARYRNIVMQQKLGQPVSAVDQAFKAAYEKQKTLVPTANFNLQNSGLGGAPGGSPSALARAVASGSMKWQDVISPRTPMSVKAQFANEVKAINPGFDTSTFGIEQKAAEKATSGTWADTRLAYDTAIDHADQLLTAAKALGNGDVQKLNQLKNYFATQFGSPDASTAQAIANAYNHEVTSVVAKGHMTDAEVAQGHGTLDVNKASPDQIAGVAQAYKNLMTSKRDELDKIIHAGAGNKANGVLNVQAGQDTKPASPPPGATHTARGSDGKMHFTNAQGQDLGVAQ